MINMGFPSTLTFYVFNDGYKGTKEQPTYQSWRYKKFSELRAPIPISIKFSGAIDSKLMSHDVSNAG